MTNDINSNMQKVHLQGVGPHLKALLFIKILPNAMASAETIMLVAPGMLMPHI